MTNRTLAEDPVKALAFLDDPNRRQLYALVAASDRPMGRDEAATSLGISRELAAFHLDRLVSAGLLETEYRRLGGRTGPGAGRPSKLYRRADRDFAVSFPPRHYDLVADVMATALDRMGEVSGVAAAATVARERGKAAGAARRKKLAGRPGRRRLMTGLLDVLRDADYEPKVDRSAGTVVLRNCPYHDLAQEHRDLTCGMNLAWAEGVLDELGSPMSAELVPEPGRCCVVFRDDQGGSRDSMAPGRSSVTDSKPVPDAFQPEGDCIEAGKVTPVIDRTHPLGETADAMRHVERGHVGGKVIISIRA